MVIGEDAGLRPGHGHGLGAQVLDRHAEECHGNLLTGADEDIELAGIGIWTHFATQSQQPVGVSRPSREHHHQLVTSLFSRHHAPGHRADALHVGDRSTTIFLNHKRHIVFNLPGPSSSTAMVPLSCRFATIRAKRGKKKRQASSEESRLSNTTGARFVAHF